MGDRTLSVVGSADVFSSGFGHSTGGGKTLPCGFWVVADVIGHFGPYVLQCCNRDFGLLPGLLQRISPTGKGIKSAFLVILQFEHFTFLLPLPVEFVGQLAKGDAQRSQFSLTHVLPRSEDPRFLLFVLVASADALGSFCVEHCLLTAEPIHVRLIQQVVVGLATLVEQTVIVLRFQRIGPN